MGETTFIDNFHGGGKEDDYAFRVVVMQHIKKILGLASREFRGGYWIEKTNLTTGGVTQKERVYIPDTREEYGHAIEALHDLLLPHFLDNDNEHCKETKEFCDMISQQLEKLRQDFLKKTQAKDSEVLSSDSYSGNDKQLLEEYKFSRLRIHRQLFQALCIFTKRQEYFEELGIEE